MTTKGLTLLDLDDKKIIYRIDEDITQMQVVDKYVYVLNQNKNLFLKYDILMGTVIENIYSKNITQFVIQGESIITLDNGNLVKTFSDEKKIVPLTYPFSQFLVNKNTN